MRTNRQARAYHHHRNNNRGRNATGYGGNYQESLLDYPNTLDARGRSGKPRARQVDEIKLTSRQLYNPPSIGLEDAQGTVTVPRQQSTYDDHAFHQHHHHQHHQQQRQQQQLMRQQYQGRRKVNNARNVNPAKDMGWDLSCCCIQCIRTQQIGIVENCGQFEEIVGPGLYCGNWPCSCVVAKLSLRVQQLDITIETKTSDNVFLCITISVQFRVIVQMAYEAYYVLADTHRQIHTYVYDTVRSTIPRLSLDGVFTSKSYVADAVFTRLHADMKQFGYEMVAVLVASIRPNAAVMSSMNEVNASRRIKEAAPHRAEAQKIEVVKQAEANSEALYLHGIGIARQRNEIIKGLKESFLQDQEKGEVDKDNADLLLLSSSSPPSPPSSSSVMKNVDDIIEMLLMSQYFDTLHAIGANDLLIQLPYIAKEKTAGTTSTTTPTDK